MSDLTGKIIAISGGTQGLGEAIARTAAAAGAGGLVLAGRSAARGDTLADDLSSAGTPTVFVEVDLVDPAAPRTITDAALDNFGLVHGLVNVAAATSRATLFDDSPEHFDHQMAINAKAPYFLIQAIAAVMIERATGGSIVNIGSTSGHGGQSKLTAYSMSKAALSVMTKNLAFGLMRHGIRVNQVNPGWMDTESEHRTQLVYDGAPENWLELAEAQRPMGRLVKPWEVANVVALCLSDDSGLLTGNCIDIDQSVQGAGDPPIPSAADTVTPPSAVHTVVEGDTP
jgi:NAD(P)-dependent dehydrogenase (short-subunit alcohol dehydrogenase family)